MGVVVSYCVLLLCGILLYCIAREKDREAAKLIETYIQTYKIKSNENRKRTIISTSYKKKTKIGNNHKR